MGIEILRKRIVLENHCLDKHINTAILKKLTEVAENDCTKDYGYIIKVLRVVRIVDNYISNVNSELIFIVDFEAETIKPEVNTVYEDEIYLVLRGGIFFEVSKKFKVLIPPNALSDFTFNADSKVYERQDIKLSKGTKCRVKITGIRYMNKKFDCFGELLPIN